MGFISFGVKAGNFGLEVRGERDRERSTTSALAVNMGDDEMRENKNPITQTKKLLIKIFVCFFFFWLLLLVVIITIFPYINYYPIIKHKYQVKR